MDVLPGEQEEVFLEHRLDVSVRKALADGAAVFVIHHAGRLVENFPASFPGEIAQVRVFQIKRFEQLVKPAQLQKLLAVERAGAAAAVETGIELTDFGLDAMPYAESSLQPPALRQAGFFARLVGIGKEDLAGDGEGFIVGE